MMRSLYAGVSGLRNHQTRMDVIGNNIANVNTVGFKASRVTFQDVLSQTMQGASAGNGSKGGTNPMQVGLGMGVASIDTLFTDGSFQPTGKPTDLSIQGQGFFILTDGTNQVYTRAGNFDFDNEGNYLVPGTGYKVAGWVADASGIINPNGPVTGIQIPVGSSMAAKVSSLTTNTGNLSADAAVGSTAQASTDIYDSLGIAHKMNTTYYKVDNTTWLSKTTVTDGSITADSQWQQISFNTDGSFKNAVTIFPPAATATSLTIPSLQMDNTPNAVHTANHTVIDADGIPHSVAMTFTTNSDGKGWSYKISESGVKNPTIVEGTMGLDTSTNTYVDPITSPLAVSVGGKSYDFNFTLTPSAAGTFNAALSVPTYVPNAVTQTALTISGLKLDTTPNAVLTTPSTLIVDASGTPHAITTTYTTNATGDGWTYTINGTGTTPAPTGTIGWSGTDYTTLPTSVTIAGTTYSIATTTDPTASSFKATIAATTPSATLDNYGITPTTGATAMSIQSNLNAISSYAGESTIQMTKDGYGAGTLDTTYIDSTGIIVGTFTNGQTKNLGQVALATFNNPSGLNKVGDNMFTKSTNSGDEKIGTSGSGGRGTFNPGSLEMANVDLAQEFSNMIITQRGFQANSKIITTTDQMLEELANLKR